MHQGATPNARRPRTQDTEPDSAGCCDSTVLFLIAFSFFVGGLVGEDQELMLLLLLGIGDGNCEAWD